MAGENLLPNSYQNIKDAFKVAGQIRRASLIVKNEAGLWKILIINNRTTLYEDLKILLTTNDETFININDSYGNIQRNKVQLNLENISYFARVIGEFTPNEQLIQKVPDLALRLKKLIEKKEEQEAEIEVQKKQEASRTGNFDILPMNLSYSFKNFTPEKFKIKQKLNDKCYESLALEIVVKDKNVVNALAPLIKKAKFKHSDVMRQVLNNKAIELHLTLKEVILDKVKYKIFEIQNFSEMFEVKNPLNKDILKNLANYDITELKFI